MEKKYKNGLVLGKLYPPTNGHLYLINTALQYSEFVTVLICSLKSETISGVLRYKWLCEIYKDNNNIKIIHVEEELPQYPEEHKDFWNIWYNVVYSRISNLDVIFTSEEYGEPFSKVLHIKHHLVDLERKLVPISATKIRNNALKYWNFIPDVVKPYFTKKICIIGTESVGKTTLCENLSKYYNCDYIEEYGRTYSIGKDCTKYVLDDFEKIAIGHNKLLFDYKKTNKLLFVDTDALITKTYIKMYLGDNVESDIVNNFILEQNFDLIIFLDYDTIHINDGMRDFGNERKKHFDMICDELVFYKKKYHLLSGSFNYKFNESIKLINELLY